MLVIERAGGAVVDANHTGGSGGHVVHVYMHVF